jgi:hypothetical protein
MRRSNLKAQMILLTVKINRLTWFHIILQFTMKINISYKVGGG